MPELKRTLLVSRIGNETRTALLEGGHLVDFSVDFEGDHPLVGSLYMGKVERVVPGLQAAFVDIGAARAAFLYAGDAGEEQGGEREDNDEAPEARGERRVPPIRDLVHENQLLLLQISKEAMKGKGARLTRSPSLPGRYLVFLPRVQQVRISRRIEDPEQRAALESLVAPLVTEAGGFIVRTAALEADPQELAKDAQLLRERWAGILRVAQEHSEAPALIWKGADPVLRALQDSPKLDEVVVDSQALLDWKPEVEGWHGAELVLHPTGRSLMSDHSLDKTLRKLVARRVWLPSGGLLVIDRTEALTAIDVNTGRYVGKNSQAQTVLKTNLEAAKEVARQLRLRDIGGIIVIDFIDMMDGEHRQQVEECMAQSLAADPARTSIAPLSEFGLMEMTRKRVRGDVTQRTTYPCGDCSGQARVWIPRVLLYRGLRKVLRAHGQKPSQQGWTLALPPGALALAKGGEQSALEELQARIACPVRVEPLLAHDPEGSDDGLKVLRIP